MADLTVVGGVFREILVGHGRREVRLAGSGLYAALAAAHAGATVDLVATIGEDDVGLAEALCAARGVRGHWLVTGSESATFVMDAAWWRAPRPLYRPAGAPSTEALKPPAAAAIVLVFGHPEWEPERSPFVAGLVRDARLLWDRQGWLSRSHSWRGVPALGAREAILLANTGEMAELLGVSPEHVLDQAVPDDFAAAVIKDGPWGVHTTTSAGAIESFGAHRVLPRASIGSGDVFAGTLAAALASGHALDEGCRRASLAAAEAIASPDPLDPRPLATAPLRPVITPARRGALQCVVEASELWSARLVASALSDAVGISCSAQTGANPGGVRLIVSRADGERSAMIVDAGDLDTLLGELVEGVLDLAGQIAA